jgi:hypothetical protein
MLSTPTNAGLAIDLVSLAIVFAGLAAFVVGLADLWTRVRRVPAPGTFRDVPGAMPLEPITLGAYAAVALVGLAVAVMLFGGPGIPVAQAVFLALATWGLYVVTRRAGRLRDWWASATAADVVRVAALGAAACWSIWFWADVFRDHVALPVELDGIAHTAWYLRIMETGMPTLGRVPRLFAPIFGLQTVEFYPTGTHALIAITSGFWGQWGVISHAGILKAWFTLAVAAAPWALFWVARRLMPRMPWWIGLAVVVGAMPGFRFPVEAAHEGGASRIFAHVLLAPIYADVVLGRFTRWRWQPVAGIFLALSFLMHPTAFVTLAALLAYAGVCAAAGSLDRRGRGPRIATLTAPALGVAVGGLIAAGLLRWNHAEVLPRTVEAFSWTALGHRLLSGWHTLFDPGYGMDPVKLWLTMAGLVLLVWRRNALGVSRRRLPCLPGGDRSGRPRGARRVAARFRARRWRVLRRAGACRRSGVRSGRLLPHRARMVCLEFRARERCLVRRPAQQNGVCDRAGSRDRGRRPSAGQRGLGSRAHPFLGPDIHDAPHQPAAGPRRVDSAEHRTGRDRLPCAA